MKYDRPIHELLGDAAHELREPFAAKDVLAWFAAHYPDVAPSAVRAHIQAMTGNVPNREANHPNLGARPPLLRRVGRGLYVRWSGSSLPERMPAPAAPPAVAAAPLSTHITTTSTPAVDEWFWEGAVQSALLGRLVSQGWDIVRVADTGSRESGTDVIARQGGRVLHVEVKGWPSLSYRDPAKSHLKKPTQPATQARVWFNDAVVHGLRLRDAHPQDEVALCFPDRETYRTLCRRIAGSLAKCDVAVLLVDENGRCVRLDLA